METIEKKQGINKQVYIAAIVALLLVNSLTIFLYFDQKEATTDLTAQKTELQQEFSSLSDTLNLRNTEVEQYIGKNQQLDAAIAEKQEQMDKQKAELRSLLSKGKLTQRELNKARALIAEYKTSITDMTARIDQLTQENQALLASNTQLTTDLTTERTTTSMLSEQNKGLSQKVDVGSLLPIAKVDVDAVKTRNNGKEVTVRRAKAASNLRIQFETGENRVLDPGQVDLYVRIINPKGETISVADQGSGTIQTPESSEPIPYTKKAEFDYNQTNKKVIVYWGKHIQEPGTYKVELYQRGRVVGQGAVQLS